MATLTVHPDDPRTGPGSPAAFSRTGGAGALRDASDSTFILLDGQFAQADVDGGTFTLPAGQKVASATITLRVQGNAGDQGYVFFADSLADFAAVSDYLCFALVTLPTTGTSDVTAAVSWHKAKPTTADVAAYVDPGFLFRSFVASPGWKVLEASIEFTHVDYTPPTPLPNAEWDDAIPLPVDGPFELDFDAAGVSSSDFGVNDAFYTFTAPADGYLSILVDCDENEFPYADYYRADATFTDYENNDVLGDEDVNSTAYGSFDDTGPGSWFTLSECWLEAGEEIRVALSLEEPRFPATYRVEARFMRDDAGVPPGATAGVLAVAEVSQASGSEAYYRLLVIDQAGGVYTRPAQLDFLHPFAAEFGDDVVMQADYTLVRVADDVAVLATWGYHATFYGGDPAHNASRGYACIVRYDGTDITMGDWATVYSYDGIDNVSGSDAFIYINYTGIGVTDNGHVVVPWFVRSLVSPYPGSDHSTAYRIDGMDLVQTDDVSEAFQAMGYGNRMPLSGGRYLHGRLSHIDGSDGASYRISEVSDAGELTLGEWVDYDNAGGVGITVWKNPVVIPGTDILILVDLGSGGGADTEQFDDQTVFGLRALDANTGDIGEVSWYSSGWFHWQTFSFAHEDYISNMMIGLGSDGQPALSFQRGQSGARANVEVVTVPLVVNPDLTVTIPALDSPISSGIPDSPYVVVKRVPVGDDVSRFNPSFHVIRRDGWAELTADYEDQIDTLLVHGTSFFVGYRAEWNGSSYDEIQTLWANGAGDAGVAWSDDLSGPNGFTEYLWPFCWLYGGGGVTKYELQDGSILYFATGRTS